MGAELKVFSSRQEWLENRKTIGGSDASAVIGRNPYKTNQQLYHEITSIETPKEFDNPFMAYGRASEPYLREMFKLDYPQLKVDYIDNNMWINQKYPYAHASLDSWAVDKKGRFGIIEFKTTEILRSRQKEEWNERIPDNYYIQLLHYFLVTEADFAVLKARLKSQWDGEIRAFIKHYWIEREEVIEDIEELRRAEDRFYFENIKKGIEPPLILPSL